MEFEFSFLGETNRPRIGEVCYPWRMEANRLDLTKSTYRRRKASLKRAIEKLHQAACTPPLGCPAELAVGELVFLDWTLLVTRTAESNLVLSIAFVEQIQTWLTKRPEWRILLMPNLRLADSTFIYWDYIALPAAHMHLTLEEYLGRSRGGILTGLDGSEISSQEMMSQFDNSLGRTGMPLF